MGTGEVDVDLLLDNAVTREAAWVEVRSRCDQAVLNDYLERFRRDGTAQHFFPVCHSRAANLQAPADTDTHLWGGPELARAALSAGLLDLLVERTR